VNTKILKGGKIKLDKLKSKLHHNEIQIEINSKKNTNSSQPQNLLSPNNNQYSQVQSPSQGSQG